MITNLFHKLAAAHKNGTAEGFVSICSANPFVIKAALEHARQSKNPALIESTGQQVNQNRGYAGFTPALFARCIRQTALAAGLDDHQVILGADHLGPGPWQAASAKTAMTKACELVRQCVAAGYQKLHLDPSMPCRDDIQPADRQHDRPELSPPIPSKLPIDTIAHRTALLCKTAENAAEACFGQKNRLIYVVGAEVPVPGGMAAGDTKACASSGEDVDQTIDAMARAFARSGLESAWERCIAVVADTGASFSAETIYPYATGRMENLRSVIRGHENLIYEAHSTDFQTQRALTDMVRDHFAILKTGPCLTYAAREALFALAAIEQEFLGQRKTVTLSRLPAVMRQCMCSNPVHWQNHYKGSDEDLYHLLLYGFSDRIRYYWSCAESRTAVARLLENLTHYGMPLPLISQYLPDILDVVRSGRVPSAPEHLVVEKIATVLRRYTAACDDAARS